MLLTGVAAELTRLLELMQRALWGGTGTNLLEAARQAGAVFANFFADRMRLSDEQRRLLVACGAGAGMSAAYGVPLGGELFSLEVMRGVLVCATCCRPFRVAGWYGSFLDSAA